MIQRLWLDFGAACATTSEISELDLDLVMHLVAASEDPGHAMRVAVVSQILAEKSAVLGAIAPAAFLHDIGKSAIPNSVLLKSAPLTAEEKKLIRCHAEVSFAMLSAILPDTLFAASARQVARYHHERWDGGGYPAGLSKGEIPISARIVALADALDVLASDRIYKDACPVSEAFESIRGGFGSAFDPGLERALDDARDEIFKIYETK